MRATSDLGKLHSAAMRRIARIRQQFGSIPTRPAADRTIMLSSCVIDLDNLSVSMMRQFMISSLTKTRTTSGQNVTVNRRFSDESEVAAFALSVLNLQKYNRLGRVSILRKEEPTIRDPKDLEKVFLRCAASNLTSLQSALALNVSFFRDLPTVRNFYAHRNDDTWRKVKSQALNLGLFTVRHTDDLITSIIPGRPVSIIEDWLFDAQQFFTEVVK